MAELALTDRAVVGVHILMDALVPHQIALVTESVATVLALIDIEEKRDVYIERERMRK